MTNEGTPEVLRVESVRPTTAPPGGGGLPPLSTSQNRMRNEDTGRALERSGLTMSRALERSGLTMSRAYAQGTPAAGASPVGDLYEGSELGAGVTAPSAPPSAHAPAGGPQWGVGELEAQIAAGAHPSASAPRREASPLTGKRMTLGSLAEAVQARKDGRRAVVASGDVDGPAPNYFDPATLPVPRTTAATAAAAIAAMRRRQG